MKRYAFTLALLVYLLHFMLPLAQGLNGVDIELRFWEALATRRIAPESVTTAWALRWLIHILLMGMAWLRVPEVNTWVYWRIDGRFLHQLLSGWVGFILLYIFLLDGNRWNWGMLYWGFATVGVIAVHIWAPVPLRTVPQRDLEIHLVPLDED